MKRIGVLLFPDFQLLDAAGPIAAFEIASRYAGGGYDLRVLAAEAGPVRSSAGMSLHAEAFADRARLRAAIDQRFVPLDAPLDGAREVAIFPPVTGG